MEKNNRNAHVNLNEIGSEKCWMNQHLVVANYVKFQKNLTICGFIGDIHLIKLYETLRGLTIYFFNDFNLSDLQ